MRRRADMLEVQVEGRGVQRKLTAILSADGVGYSRLMADDDVATVRMLTEHRGVMKTIVEGYRGRVVDSPGDNVLAEFPSVVDAVECAVVIQKELKARNDRVPPNRQMQFRIGINLGDVIVDGDRIYGDGVNIAARLESLAEPGGICISGSAYDQIENKLPLGYESLGPQTVKNFSKPVRVYRAITGTEPVVDATDIADTAAPPTRVVRSESESTPTPAVAAPSAASVPASRRRAALVAGVLVALGAIGGIAAWRLTSPAPTTAAIPAAGTLSLAVLPIVNATGDTGRDAITAQLDAEVRAGLSRLSGLVTSPASAVLPYRSRAVSVSQAARELHVRYVFDGSVRIVDGRPRVVATLVDTTTGNTLWTERFDRPLTTVAAMQDDLLKRIVAALPITPGAKEPAPRATKPASAKPLDTAVDSSMTPRAPRGDAVQRQRVEPAPAPQLSTPGPPARREFQAP
jgi:adenylate cyclase